MTYRGTMTVTRQTSSLFGAEVASSGAAQPSWRGRPRGVATVMFQHWRSIRNVTSIVYRPLAGENVTSTHLTGSNDRLQHVIAVVRWLHDLRGIAMASCDKICQETERQLKLA